MYVLGVLFSELDLSAFVAVVSFSFAFVCAVAVFFLCVCLLLLFSFVCLCRDQQYSNDKISWEFSVIPLLKTNGR